MEYDPPLPERFRGCLLGLAIGDGLGARFEGQPAEHIRARFPTVRELIDNPPNNELWYTDDTQMAIGVAETLAEHRSIIEDMLCAAFIAAMTGALSGAHLGVTAIPDSLVKILEDVSTGRSYILELADRLYSAYTAMAAADKS